MKTMKAMRIAGSSAWLLFLFACAHGIGRDEPRFAPVADAAEGLEVFQTGIASWYGDDFQGKATANGEVYDMYKLTAAHQELPFHTLIEVENLENGRKVLVRINDRGPFLKDRIIDLSLKAAQRLDMTAKGTAEVNLRVVRLGEAPGDKGLAPVRPGTCFVQAGAFSVRENAEDMLRALGDIFPEVAFRIAEEDGMFKIISQEMASAASCQAVIRKLAEYRLQGFIRETGVSGGE